MPFNVSDCVLGQNFDSTFHMKSFLHISCDELRKRLKKRLIVSSKLLPVVYLDDRDLECWPKCDLKN